MFLRLALLFAAAVSSAAQTVEGTVINSATGAGLPGVKIDLWQGGDIWYSATSDAQGHFLFDRVDDGVYIDRYSAPGFWWERDPGPVRQFRMTAGGNPVKLEARMTPLARLSGRVVDGTGKPVPGARACAMGPRQAMCVPTDAEGKFDLRNEIAPDPYLLVAGPPPGLKPPDPEPESGRLSNWIGTWFPGVPTQDGAARIQLNPGANMAGIEVKLLAAPAQPVSGVLLNAEGRPAPHVELRLTQAFAALTAESQADGTFAFPAVTEAAGSWRRR